jgi:hypothetical protein
MRQAGGVADFQFIERSIFDHDVGHRIGHDAYRSST